MLIGLVQAFGFAGTAYADILWPFRNRHLRKKNDTARASELHEWMADDLQRDGVSCVCRD